MNKVTVYGFDAEVNNGVIVIQQALEFEEHGSEIKLSMAEAKVLCEWIAGITTAKAE